MSGSTTADGWPRSIRKWSNNFAGAKENDLGRNGTPDFSTTRLHTFSRALARELPAERDSGTTWTAFSRAVQTWPAHIPSIVRIGD
jgi:hypothetical protein